MLESLQNAIRQNTAQTDLPEKVFFDAIEEALRAEAYRIYGDDANISIEINSEKGDIRCYVPKKVVNIMRDFLTEISIEEARKLNPNIRVGQMLDVEIKPTEFGRVQAQRVRQHIFQKIKQAEREKICAEFAGREGEVVTGYVQRPERGGVILDLEQTQTEAFLPRRELPRSQTYDRGKRLQCLILSVQSEVRGPPIIVSRVHQDLISVLFEQEVPEIFEGQVQIMAVARDPGNRAKVAVRAVEEGIDAVGTCVGVKGIRVQTIVNELDDEKIDLIEWSEDASVFIANALGGRVDVRRVELNEADKSALVVVPDSQLSLAIGQRGQNARLSARLTGWRVDIKGESEVTVSINDIFKPVADTEMPLLLDDATRNRQETGDITAATPTSTDESLPLDNAEATEAGDPESVPDADVVDTFEGIFEDEKEDESDA